MLDIIPKLERKQNIKYFTCNYVNYFNFFYWHLPPTNPNTNVPDRLKVHINAAK